MSANQAYDALAYYYPEQAAWWDDLDTEPFHTNSSFRAAKRAEYETFYFSHRNRLAFQPGPHFGPLYRSQHHMKKGLALACKAHPSKFQEVFEGVDGPTTDVQDVVNALVLRMLCFKNRQEQVRLTAEHKAAVKKMRE